MQQPKISVIVPIYNTEKYIHRCIDSILLQTFSNFECILINDCSPDNSGKIIDEYQKKDERIKVIHKPENEGLPRARKTGLDNAFANFVMHVDSDDWLELDALQVLLENQEKNNAEIVRARLSHHYPNYIHNSIVGFPYDNKNDPLICFFLNGYNTLCATLYKKGLFSDYFVPEVSLGEDAITNVQIFSRVMPDKICYINNVIYNYDHRTSGITKSTSDAYEYFEEIPVFKYRLFIQKYLNDIGRNTNDVISAFSYDFIFHAILPYILTKKNMSKKEMGIFHKDYWKRCNHKNLFKRWERKLIPIYYISPKLGKIYVLSIRKIVRFASKIKRIIFIKCNLGRQAE